MTEQTEQPAPCPWCGAGSQIVRVMTDTFWVSCQGFQNCEAQGPSRHTRAEAVAEWNRIAQTDTRALAREELRRELVGHPHKQCSFAMKEGK